MKTGTLEDFTGAYITASLWSSNDDDGEPLDANYDEHDIATATLEAMRTDCHEFWNANRRDILESAHLGEYVKRNSNWSIAELAGHDFWLTRNHHGAGFWDRGLGDVGARLTAAAHAFSGCDLYVGDDGKVYL